MGRQESHLKFSTMLHVSHWVRMRFSVTIENRKQLRFSNRTCKGDLEKMKRFTC